MYSLNSFDQNWTYNNNDNNIDYHFAICETCFWTATIFNSVKKRNKYDNTSHKRSISTYPICSSKNISMISIPIHENDTNKMKSHMLMMQSLDQYAHLTDQLKEKCLIKDLAGLAVHL
jgi:hypothetical protein